MKQKQATKVEKTSSGQTGKKSSQEPHHQTPSPGGEGWGGAKMKTAIEKLLIAFFYRIPLILASVAALLAIAFLIAGLIKGKTLYFVFAIMAIIIGRTILMDDKEIKKLKRDR